MKHLMLLLFSAVFFASCKKDIESLPEATQSGAHTFGAKVDGSLWVPQKSALSSADLLLEARITGSNSLFINARNFASSPTETEFEIHLKDLAGTGTYLLNTNTQKYPYHTASYGYFIKRKFMPLNEWITGSNFTGSVTLTKLDTVAKIISGSFEFQAGSTDSTASPLQVTEGRFDIKLQ